jgi:hypothetical protein
MESNLVMAIILGIISPVVTAVIGLIAYKMIKKQFASAQTQHQVQGLLDAFKILDTDEHRNSRSMVYALYFEYLDTKQLKSFKGSKDVESVRGAFDVMGILVKTENIHKNDFLEMYGVLAYRCWQCLKADIENERDSRNFPKFMYYFQWLANASHNYWFQNNDVDLSRIKLYHPDDPTRWVDFSIK